MKVLEGKFLENHFIRVSIDGNHYTRKVRYNRMDGLYIVVNDRKYFEYEAEYEAESQYESGKRVAQIGIDILVEGNTNGYTIAETVKNALKSKGFIVVGSLFIDDLTEAYKSTNPDLFNKH